MLIDDASGDHFDIVSRRSLEYCFAIEHGRSIDRQFLHCSPKSMAICDLADEKGIYINPLTFP
jgi:hypothetical protein